MYILIVNLPIIGKSTTFFRTIRIQEVDIMPSKKGPLFSIGEVSRIMEVNPKSILYYERLGILSPSKTNKATKYRFYSVPQLGILSAIKICVQLGIPLRNFSKYNQNNTIDTSALLTDAAAVIQKKIQSLQTGLEFIEQMQDYITLSSRLQNAGGILELPFPEMRFAATEIPENLSPSELLQVLAQLKHSASRKPLSGLLFGKIAFWHDSRITKLYAVRQVNSDDEGNLILTLPAGTYSCLVTPDSRITKTPELFPLSGSPDLISFESILVPDPFQTNKINYILRCIAQQHEPPLT